MSRPQCNHHVFVWSTKDGLHLCRVSSVEIAETESCTPHLQGEGYGIEIKARLLVMTMFHWAHAVMWLVPDPSGLFWSLFDLTMPKYSRGPELFFLLVSCYLIDTESLPGLFCSYMSYFSKTMQHFSQKEKKQLLESVSAARASFCVLEWWNFNCIFRFMLWTLSRCWTQSR